MKRKRGIYIYIYRERERECVCVCVSVCVCVCERAEHQKLSRGPIVPVRNLFGVFVENRGKTKKIRNIG